MSFITRTFAHLSLFVVVANGLIPDVAAQELPPDANTDIVKGLSMDGVLRSSLSSQNNGLQFGYKPVFRDSLTAYTGEKQVSESRKKVVEIGLKETKSVTVPIRPMQGFMQVANSDDVAKMVKGMIKMKVPVLYQTMMMVENGAATGFIGAMGNMNGLLDSTMQASQLQLAMHEAFDPGGQRAHEYGKAVYEQLQVPSHENSWPMALWAANSDELDPDKANSNVKGSKVTHKYTRPANNTLGGPGVNPNIVGTPQPDNAVKEFSLTDALFEPLEKGGQ